MTQSFVISGDLLIGADSTGDNKSVRAINPATGANLEPAFAIASEADVARACELAGQAFDTYRATSPEARATFLETIATDIMEIGDALIERATDETGLPAARLQGERARTVGQLRLFAQVVRSGEWLDLRVDPALPDRKPLPRPDLRLPSRLPVAIPLRRWRPVARLSSRAILPIRVPANWLAAPSAPPSSPAVCRKAPSRS
jgi:NADP-dependent aldehyde dehydrogenase